jgi:hypothetical protein
MNEEQTKNENEHPQQNNFSAELESESNKMDAEKFAQKQAEYKQILEANEPLLDEDAYI